jgi:hypothetical protein
VVADEEEIIYKENEGMRAVDNSEVRNEVGSVMEFNELITNKSLGKFRWTLK